jgi:hypothetical protein
MIGILGANFGTLRADQLSARQGGFKYLKKTVFLADNGIGWHEFLLQRESGLRIGKAKYPLAVQQFDQVKLNFIVICHPF